MKNEDYTAEWPQEIPYISKSLLRTLGWGMISRDLTSRVSATIFSNFRNLPRDSAV